jgi:hypothetical protein
MKSPISPTTGKEMILLSENKTFIKRGIEIEMQYQFYLCIDSGEKYTTTELEEINLNLLDSEFKRLSRELRINDIIN